MGRGEASAPAPSGRGSVRAPGALLAALAIAAWLAPPDGAAQDGTARHGPGDRRLELPEFRIPDVPRFELPPVAPAPESAPLSAGPRFVLRAVTFSGNTVIDDAELAGVAEPLLGRLISTEELASLRRDLTRYYIDRGYVSSGAVLPDQTVSDGLVHFEIVEGALTRIVLTGAERLRDYYLADRIALGSGPPLNVVDLQERLQILLQDPAIDGLDARLGPGTRPGESELRVSVVESSPFSARLTLGNSRSPSVGAEELRGDFQLVDLAGFGEQVLFGASFTRGLLEKRGELRVPVSSRGTRVFARAREVETRVVEAPFSLVDVQSKSTDLGIGVVHPFYRTVGQELALGLEVSRRESQTFLLGQPFPFAAGVEVDGTSVVSVARFTQSWLDRGRNQVLALRSTVSLGHEGHGATVNPGPLPDGRFLSWLGQFQWARRFTERSYQLIVRGDVQLSRDPLLPLEKFALGGAETIRGYRENEVVADNGWAVSVEGRIPLLDLSIPGLGEGAGDGRLELAPFVDYGRSWDRSVPGLVSSDVTTLASIGAGLRFQTRGNLVASVYYARRLREVRADRGTNLQDHGLHFRLSAEF